MRLTRIISILFLVICIGAALFWLSLRYFQSEELQKAEGRLSVFRGTVVSEIERFSHLTFVLARDPLVMAAASGGDATALNSRLASFSERADLDAIYLMQPDGLTIAASNAGAPSSFVGQNYSFRPYFQDALSGLQGRFYGIGATTGLPGYFIADPVNTHSDTSLGVIAIKIDLSKLEDSWRRSGEQVLLTNSDGVVLLASDPAWRYRVLATLSDTQRSKINESRQFPGQSLQPLDWAHLGAERAMISGEERLHLMSLDLPHDWQLHYFASDDPAVTRSWLVTGSVAMLAGLILIFFQVQRGRRMRLALVRSEQEEAELRQANEQLAIEVDERRTAERRLARTQGELESASRLAALGRLAASVTHELGQPIAAMRNHLAAAELGSGSLKSTPAMQGLVDRMEGITRQLRFFARSGVEDFAEVDLVSSARAALELVGANIVQNKVALECRWPDEPAIVRGNQLRLEQVMTNLLRNALDAIEDVTTPKMEIEIGTSEELVWFEIQDNGHGLGQFDLAELQEPFMTTRESGRGMGLGLAISTGIVTDHGGRMIAKSKDTGGAVFRVEFPNDEDLGE